MVPVTVLLLVGTVCAPNTPTPLHRQYLPLCQLPLLLRRALNGSGVRRRPGSFGGVHARLACARGGGGGAANGIGCPRRSFRSVSSLTASPPDQHHQQQQPYEKCIDCNLPNTYRTVVSVSSTSIAALLCVAWCCLDRKISNTERVTSDFSCDRMVGVRG
jgi:hypothetical protein